mmetsp:Transcript_19644/g.38941  ORF Transcript_19644/g.38941 Transcript_19644/m.38941 type:complete len:202 (+) Transcript_19644:1095-1700(+)
MGSRPRRARGEERVSAELVRRDSRALEQRQGPGAGAAHERRVRVGAGQQADSHLQHALQGAQREQFGAFFSGDRGLRPRAHARQHRRRVRGVFGRHGKLLRGAQGRAHRSVHHEEDRGDHCRKNGGEPEVAHRGGVYVQNDAGAVHPPRVLPHLPHAVALRDVRAGRQGGGAHVPRLVRPGHPGSGVQVHVCGDRHCQRLA